MGRASGGLSMENPRSDRKKIPTCCSVAIGCGGQARDGNCGIGLKPYHDTITVSPGLSILTLVGTGVRGSADESDFAII
jgi:hypothetical protein